MGDKVTACLYCRTAREDGQVLEQQKRNLLSYVEIKGYEVIGIFGDSGSGLTMGRAGWNQVLNVIREQKVDVVLIANMERISRRPALMKESVEYLNTFGVRLETLFHGMIYGLEPEIDVMMKWESC